jgi:AmmeMemoRadiSam system protein B
MTTNAVRQPAFAGMFYAATRRELLASLDACFRKAGCTQLPPAVDDDGPRRILGLVSPHAGYVYSGTAAAKGYLQLAQDGRPEVFVVVGPNHGRSFVNGIQTGGWWETPLGRSPIAGDLATAIAKDLDGFTDGVAGFAGEHSLEVQLPFIQYVFGLDTPIVPIMMLDQGGSAAAEVGGVLAKHLAGRNAVIIASTDMTHFESADYAREQDQVLIYRMLELDPDGLLRDRLRLDVSMCGYGPVAAMLHAARSLGATEAEVVDYTNSGAATGSSAEVVAYLSLVVRRAA